MKSIQFIPISLIVILAVILSIPAIAYASFQYIYPSEPDAIVTRHGNLKMEWKKLSENDNFTEYLAKDQELDEETLTADILVMRSYRKPQTTIHENSKIIYTSVVMHQSVNCRNRAISVQDLMMFSSSLTRGSLVKELYDLDWEFGEVKPGTINEKKVIFLCNYLS